MYIFLEDITSSYWGSMGVLLSRLSTVNHQAPVGVVSLPAITDIISDIQLGNIMSQVLHLCSTVGYFTPSLDELC
jgi:hypothetical protein